MIRVTAKLLLLVLVWQAKFFFTAHGAAEFLNSLPAEIALEAKVTCDNGCWVLYRSMRDLRVPAPEAK